MAAYSQALQLARAHAQAARVADMLALCRSMAQAYADSADAMLDVGSLLLGFGFLSEARACFTTACQLAPDDLRALANLAHVEHEAGNHAASRRIGTALLAHNPNHAVLRRNALVGLEYDPSVTDQERLAQARAWGAWAIARAGGARSRPTPRAAGGRPLRVAYLSADFCQHTVGLFVRPVLAAHDQARVQAFAYSAGQVRDWVSQAIEACTRWRDVAALDDTALAALLRQDEIDVLVDLSGHTAGSRLSVCAHRPAPVMVSWLGYFASTGLPTIDAVLLDTWHAPPGTQAQFAEPVVLLPNGRFCYQPVPWAPPQPGLPPCAERGYVTFGSFNNTAKLNAGLFDVWARVLAAVPDARLVLKWRTLVDPALCAGIRAAFTQRGIDPRRLDLRPASFHAAVLREYGDIDIALDTFPFSGGMTSCEALWMGVPVITWPQSRVVSRQTHALLCAIGLPELVAADAHDYVRIASSLAGDRSRLLALRSGMRERMLASPLMDVRGFTRQLETTLHQLHAAVLEHAAPGA